MLSAGGRVISSVPQRLRILNQRLASHPVSTSCHVHAKQKQVGEGEPIPFSTSKAASWSMTNTVVMPERDIPWYQSLSIGLSMTVFMLYFFFLREENDLDIELNYSLFERVPHLEEHQLKVAVDYYRSQGRDTRELEKRLKEIQQNKQLQKEQES